MTKKKTTSKKKSGQAEAATEDATFESVNEQPTAADSIAEKSKTSPPAASISDTRSLKRSRIDWHAGGGALT